MNIIIDTDRVTGQLRRAVGDDFIGVHVEGSSGPSLNAVGDKPFIQLPANHFITGLRNVF